MLCIFFSVNRQKKGNNIPESTSVLVVFLYLKYYVNWKKYMEPKTWELCFIQQKSLGLKPRRQHLK